MPVQVPKPKKWHSLQVPPAELRLHTTLRCGQSFRWNERQTGDDTVWTCVLTGRVVELCQTDSDVLFRDATGGVKVEADEKSLRATLVDYFQLETCLAEMYEYWRERDSNFGKKVQWGALAGIRILRQDPFENVLSFICSSNNNIARITQLVGKLCSEFGKALPHADDPKLALYAFPTLKALAAEPQLEARLRKLGFGYRARFLADTVRLLEAPDRGEAWLHALRHAAYPEARDALLELRGVGPKVADCICLMSLDKPGAIPVDTHVLQIARRDYRVAGLAGIKSLQARHHATIGDFFRALHGPYAGWAHTVLFTADLAAFSALGRAPGPKGDTSGRREIDAVPGPAPKRRRDAARA